MRRLWLTVALAGPAGTSSANSVAHTVASTVPIMRLVIVHLGYGSVFWSDQRHRG
jgi:hypothetical protein